MAAAAEDIWEFLCLSSPLYMWLPILETVAVEWQFFYSVTASAPIRQHRFDSASNCYVQTFGFVIVFDLSLVGFQFLSWEYM